MSTFERSAGSALRVFTSSERLSNQLKIKDIGEVGQLVKKIEMGAPKIGKLVKEHEMGDPKVGQSGEEGREWWSTSKKIDE